MTRYELSFEIEPDLYRRASTHPITERPKRVHNWRDFRNFCGVLIGAAVLYFLNRALFPDQNALAIVAGGVIGAGLVLIVWWRQHRELVGHYSKYNDTAGQSEIVIDADQIIARRPGIETRMQWSFVQSIRSIEGASLIELGTARLIIPDVALPSDLTPVDFQTQLNAWNNQG